MIDYDAWVDFITDKVEENFPKGKCKERGHALVLVAEITNELKNVHHVIEERK